MAYVLPVIKLVHQTNQQRGSHNRHAQRHHNSDDERNHLMFSVSVRHSSDNVDYSIIQILLSAFVLLCGQVLPTFGQSAQAGSVGTFKQHHGTWMFNGESRHKTIGLIDIVDPIDVRSVSRQ